MSKAPLMPMATAVWLVENTSLTFKQIADFCKLHEVEIQGIADGEVANGIVGYNPIISGQLTKDEIDLSTSLYSLLKISISLTLFRSFLSIKIIRQSEIAESPVYRASTLVIISKADDPYDIPVIENINKKIKPDNLAKWVIVILLSYQLSSC